MADSNVTFIRRNGRVIPIRKKGAGGKSATKKKQSHKPSKKKLRQRSADVMARDGNKAFKAGFGLIAGSAVAESLFTAAGKGAAKGESILSKSAKRDSSSTFFKKKKRIRPISKGLNKLSKLGGKTRGLGKAGLGLLIGGSILNVIGTSKQNRISKDKKRSRRR